MSITIVSLEEFIIALESAVSMSRVQQMFWLLTLFQRIANKNKLMITIIMIFVFILFYSILQNNKNMACKLKRLRKTIQCHTIYLKTNNQSNKVFDKKEHKPRKKMAIKTRFESFYIVTQKTKTITFECISTH